MLKEKLTRQLKSKLMYQKIIIEHLNRSRSLRYKACQFDESIEEINVRISIYSNRR